MPAKAAAAELTLEPVDNQRLARLCGAMDANLRQIESALDVVISRRGSRFTVRGDRAKDGTQALEHFYAQASDELSLDDVQLGLTELFLRGRTHAAGDEEGPKLLTRRTDLHGRTPRQVQYIEN